MLEQQPPITIKPARTLIIWTALHIAGVVIAASGLLLAGNLTAEVAGWLFMLLDVPIYALQALLLRRILSEFPARAWFLRSSGVAIVGAFFLGVIGMAAPDEFNATQLLFALVYGGIVGGGVGLVQSLILQRYSKRSELWVAAYALAVTAMGLTPVLLGQSATLLDYLLFQAPLKGAVLGLVSGIFLLRLLAQQVAPPAPVYQAPATARPPARMGVRGCGVVLLLIVGAIVLLAFLDPAPGRGVSFSGPTPPPIYAKQGEQSAAVADWQPYTSKEGFFSAVFPDDPRFKTVPLNDGSTSMQHEVFSADDSAAYIVLYIDRPADLTDGDIPALMDGMQESELQGPNRRLISAHQINVQGYIGREIEVGESGDGYGRIWMLVTDKRVYEVIAYTYDRQQTTAAMDGFLQAFKILLAVDM